VGFDSGSGIHAVLLCNQLGFTFDIHHYLDHLPFKRGASIPEMSFSVMVGANCNNIRPSISAILGQSYYVVSLHIMRAI